MSNRRFSLFLLILLSVAGLIFYRLFYLSYLKHDYFKEVSEAQYQNQKENVVRRGNIYIQDLSSGEKKLVATQKSYPYIFVSANAVENAELAAEKLSELLNISKEEASSFFSNKDSSFRIVEKNPSQEQLDFVKKLEVKGISIGYEEKRNYQKNDFLSHVLGFLGFDEDGRVGQYGVESFYDKELSGRLDEQKQIPKDGSDILLTIDENIQAFIEQELSYLMRKWSSASGVIIVEEPQTGALLGMAGSPSFDPNNYSRSNLENFLNKSVQEMFEPGSSFKPITMSAALDKKKVTPETTYFDAGEVNIAGYKIKNFNEKSFGTQTMNQVLEKSLNTGAIFVEEKLGDENFLNYVLNFGFGQVSGVDLAGESAGDISNLYSGRKINFVTASFGQGIAVTPMQLINAFAAIANGGKLLRPYVTKEVTRPNGDKLETKPELIGTPISERTSLQIKAMLVKVVENGFDKARVAGYEVAGKTGTAQIPSKSGGYSEDFIHDIVGFAPAFDPKFVILIKLEKPKGIKFASDSLSPSLGKITKFLLNYFQIPPTRQ